MATQAGSSLQSRTQNCVPTVVKQILSCKHVQFRIFDIPIQVVCLIGVIRNISIVSCEVTCEIQDHSGSINGIMRLETDSEVAAKMSGIREGNYAKVFGTVRIEGGAKVIFIMKMFPVDDLNVITNHLLHMSCFTLEAEAERNKQLASANTSGAALADSLDMSVEESDEIPERTTVPLTDFQRLIFDIVRSEHSELGISKRNILKQFPSYQGHDVNQALDFLINEGIVYCSIDQEHLKAAMF